MADEGRSEGEKLAKEGHNRKTESGNGQDTSATDEVQTNGEDPSFTGETEVQPVEEAAPDPSHPKAKEVPPNGEITPDPSHPEAKEVPPNGESATDPSHPEAKEVPPNGESATHPSQPEAKEVPPNGKAAPDPSHPGAKEVPANGETTPGPSHPGAKVVQPNGETTPVPSHPGAKEIHPNGEAAPGPSHPDAKEVPPNGEATPGPSHLGAKEVQPNGETTPSHAEEHHVLKKTPTEANGEYQEGAKGDLKANDELLPSNVQAKYNPRPPDSGDVPEMRYNSFVREIMGFLTELRNAESAAGNEEVVMESAKSNSDGELESQELSEWEYFVPLHLETISYDVNDGCDAVLEELNSETSLGIMPINPVLAAPDAHFNGIEAPPVQNEHTYVKDFLPACQSDVKLPIPEDFRNRRWFVTKEYAFKLGSSGFSYVGSIACGRMHGFGRLSLGGGQFMEGVWQMNHLVELHSCQLICDPGNQTVLIIKRQNDHLLTMYENHYVARVTFSALDELDFTRSIVGIKRAFFKKLTVLEQVADELEHRRQLLMNNFAAVLSEAIGSNADTVSRADTFLLLSLYLSRPDADLSDIINDRNIPIDVRDAARDLLRCENNYLNNTYVFSNKAAKLRLDMRKVLERVYNDGMALHRQTLLAKCPKAFPCLLLFIQELPKSKLLYLTSEDMQVFDHIASQPCFEHYKAFFMDLAERYRLAIHNIKACTAPCAVIPIMFPVYGFLVKSFWETILEIIQDLGCYEYKDMLKCESGNWKLLENIRWPENEMVNPEKKRKFFSSSVSKSSLFHRSLEIQYNVVFKMLGEFSPENYVANREHKYDFHVLEQDLSWWEKGLRMVKQKVGLARRLQHLNTERLVWLCLLDRSIHELFKGDPQLRVLLKPYNSLLQGQISFVEKSSSESHETFRVMTHSILKFIASTAPYFREAREKPGVDVEILVQQMWTFSNASQEIDEDPTKFSHFRDLIAEYNRYMNLRLFVNIESESGPFSAQISQIMQNFMHIVATSLKKSAPTTALVGYLRSLNDFLDDFKNIDFLGMFFVKSEFFDPDMLEKVDNKLTGGNCSYRVTDVGKFVQVAQPLPRHHIIHVVSQLLECVARCLDKHWQSGDAELGVAQLESTGTLLDAIRKSFMYLKEQPDYVDFDLFERESTEPFVRLVGECESLNDLKKRIGKVSESFWYIRKMDEIGIDRALEMFVSVNDCQETGVLSDCYNLYLRHYNEYVAKYRSALSEGKGHAEALDDVVQMLDRPRPFHFSMWTEDFKTKEIPVLLAGLSAVWSFLVSKDVAGTGKFLKPHCIQILCILRLLSVDLPDGAENHLAQVLTGQGKSVILGLLSSLLALTGHKVKVLCYSDYLSTRDQNDFEEFFQIFQLREKIEYGTFKEMANSFVNPVSNGKQKSLRQLVQDRVLNHTSWPSVTRVTPISKNTVLLADEVDVFFTDKFYGSSYIPCTDPGFDGLAQLQEFIWALVSDNQRYSSEQIVQFSNQHIDDEVAAGNEFMLEFRDFLDDPGTFSLLKGAWKGKSYFYSVQTYTNRSLFDEHLVRMINDALRVRDEEWARSGYKIIDGRIHCKDEHEVYSDNWYSCYRNVFNYFRLKKSNYNRKNLKNYGYLNLRVGIVSYARLPSQFQLILGVSGTLTDLGDYEKSGIEFYGIHNSSVLPSFFGESNLEFSKDADFHYFDREQDWLKEIYDRANSVVESHRAALIFFESDVEMATFSKEYKSKFDRLHEITENTSDDLRDTYIDEAGLSSTVTLATRGMGRGVDYKSSLTVEKNGGVHVIQTFFSVDVKEEVQIKGRTARKDNRGSYEMMICKQHLVRHNIVTEDDHNVHTYDSLDAVRKRLSVEKGKTVEEKIKQSEHNHSVTMKFFGLV